VEPLRQGIREHFDSYHAKVVTGPALRHDRRSHLMGDLYQGERCVLGLASNPAFVWSRRATAAPSAPRE